jgi:hypothetical protein
MATQDVKVIDPNDGQRLVFAIENDPNVILETDEQELWEDIFSDEETK